MSDGTDPGRGAQPAAPTPGGARVMLWVVMMGAIVLVVAGLVWVLKVSRN